MKPRRWHGRQTIPISSFLRSRRRKRQPLLTGKRGSVRFGEIVPLTRLPPEKSETPIKRAMKTKRISRILRMIHTIPSVESGVELQSEVLNRRQVATPLPTRASRGGGEETDASK